MYHNRDGLELVLAPTSGADNAPLEVIWASVTETEPLFYEHLSDNDSEVLSAVLFNLALQGGGKRVGPCKYIFEDEETAQKALVALDEALRAHGETSKWPTWAQTALEKGWTPAVENPV